MPAVLNDSTMVRGWLVSYNLSVSGAAIQLVATGLVAVRLLLTIHTSPSCWLVELSGSCYAIQHGKCAVRVIRKGCKNRSQTFSKLTVCELAQKQMLQHSTI